MRARPIEMSKWPGELENRPVLLGGVERNELGAHRPFVVLQTAEDAVELAQLGVENLDCPSIRITDCLLVRRCSQDCRHVFPSSNSTRRVVTRSSSASRRRPRD